jgi:predicted GNAT family acetyltransferase
VYAIREPPATGATALRRATPDDVPRLVPACAAAHQLELGIDPLARDADAFRWRTQAQVDEGRSWLWLEDDVVRFKAEASAWTGAAVQLQQVWVDPVARGRGYGARGLADLIRLLLSSTPVVTLFVRAENAPAIKLYESVGMNRELEYRSVLF